MRKLAVILAVICLVLCSCCCNSPERLADKGSNGHTGGNGGEDVQKNTLRVMTYNIHGGKDSYDNDSMERIIELVKRIDPDVLVLNEVLGTRGFPDENQAYKIAAECKMKYYFGKSINTGFMGIQEFGNAVLTKFSIKKAYKNHLFYYDNSPGYSEQRTCSCVCIDYFGKDLWIYATHLGLKDIKTERGKQLDNIFEQILANGGSSILAGDMNEKWEVLQKYDHKVYKNNFYSSNHKLLNKSIQTFSKSTEQIDYIFLSNDIKINSCQNFISDASDHYPLVAEVEI